MEVLHEKCIAAHGHVQVGRATVKDWAVQLVSFDAVYTAKQTNSTKHQERTYCVALGA